MTGCRLLRLVACTLLASLWCSTLRPVGASDLSSDFYRDEIKPLLQEKCVSCHGPVEQKAGLRLDAAALIREGSDSGAVVDVNDPGASRLIERITSELAPMPPPEEGTPLSDTQVALLKRWIAGGMPAPEDEPILGGPEDHWAFQPIERPEIPAAASPEGNPIDAFIGAKLRERGLRPAPPADRETLLRRLMLDLVGLPPTQQQRDEFLSLTSPAQQLAFIDELLASPAYGERWARHWMDVWRYSDWDGYKDQVRGSQRHIWRWRDWIVESLIADKPYDRMITEMLAGDEIAPLDPETVRATGFLARNYHHSNRNIWLNAAVEHTAKAFLGLTLNCAQCHDHKFDPIDQEAYYEFRAFFEPHQTRTDLVPGVTDTKQGGVPRVYDADLDAKTMFLIGGNEAMPDESRKIVPDVPEVLGVPLEIEPVELPLEAYVPKLRPHVERDQMAAADRRVAAARRTAAKAKGGAGEVAEAKLNLAIAERASLAARWEADRAKYHDGPGYAELAKLASHRQHEAEVAKAALAVAEKRAELAAAAQAAEKAEKSNDEAVEKKRAELEKAQAKLAELRGGGNASSRDGATKDGAKQDGAKQDGAKQDGAKQDGAKQDGAKKDDAPTPAYEPVVKAYPNTSTGRRTALARWITHEDNPLTARVAVNHIWMRHFGEPLVENVFDFGLRSPRPEYAELLDWMAAELIDSGWSMKHLHRLIVSSDAYQRASHTGAADTAHNEAIDPDNKLLWRFNVIRLDAEVIRDSLMAVAGQLDRKMGGPEIDFRKGEQVYRRSLYFRHAYEKQMVMLTTFDAASPNECYRRKASIVPQQALVLANGSLSRSMSRELASILSERVASDSSGEGAPGAEATAGDDDRFIDLAFQRVLGRGASAEELVACRDFLRTQTQRLAEPERLNTYDSTETAQTPAATSADQRARESLVHVLMNHNDFVTVR